MAYDPNCDTDEWPDPNQDWQVISSGYVELPSEPFADLVAYPQEPIVNHDPVYASDASGLWRLAFIALASVVIPTLTWLVAQLIMEAS